MHLKNKIISIQRISLPLLILVYFIILFFGLYPFNFCPKNNVHFLHGQNGIQFREGRAFSKYAKCGIAFTPNPIEITSGPPNGTMTIEFFVQPNPGEYSGLAYILSFYDGKKQEPLIIGQWRSYLVIRSRIDQNESNHPYQESGLKNALITNQKSLITIVSGKEGTEIYVNGELAKSSSKISFDPLRHITGQLVLGNSATGKNPWFGNLFGLSIYNRKLSPEQVKRNYINWTQNEQKIEQEVLSNPFIMYAFKEQRNSYVYNQVNDKNILIIPKKYKVLKRDILVPFWQIDDLDTVLVWDVVLNILGFIPLGFCTVGYLQQIKQFKKNVAYFVAVLSGSIISLAIEVIQIYLPMRYSSSLDLLCNISGTFLGVLLFIFLCRSIMHKAILSCFLGFVHLNFLVFVILIYFLVYFVSF